MRISKTRLVFVLVGLVVLFVAVFMIEAVRCNRRLSDHDLRLSIADVSALSWSNLVLEANGILEERILSLDGSMPFIVIDKKPPTISLLGSDAWINVVGEDAPYVVVERTYKDRQVSIYVKPGGKGEIKESSELGSTLVPVRPQVRVSREVVVAEQARRK